MMARVGSSVIWGSQGAYPTYETQRYNTADVLIHWTRVPQANITHVTTNW